MKNLDLLVSEIQKQKKKNKKSFDYFIPSLWIDNSKIGIENVNMFDFYLNQIHKIINSENNEIQFKNWTNNAKIYNLLIRYTTSFDHNNDNQITISTVNNFYRETGTFLKTIAILPYIKSLGINTLYFLPVTSIGIDEKKGTLGSPYSIRNPYKLDENLAEPFLELDIETQFKALIEAAHLLGMKVICEFVFRTASVDSDLAIDHPEWFYWIKSKINNRTNDPKNEKQYGPPIFSKDELLKINEKVNLGDFNNLPTPHTTYREMFTKTPSKVARVEQRIRGLLDKKNEVRIPSAFADWPPNDTQPVWSDVTYLKLFTHPDYNYIAYNTVRMYDTKLIKEENEAKDLWEFITNIIPYYQENFNIDGVMIDMGHALPKKLREEIVKKAREFKPDFIFWEENFTISQKSADEGYDAVLGYLPFDQHIHWKMRQVIELFHNQKVEIPFFATPETHNTPRAYSRFNDMKFNILSFAINSFLPIPSFIHSGFELCQENPVNTGLDFNPKDYELYPPEKLPLFSESVLEWNNENNIIENIKHINSIREKLLIEPNDFKSKSIVNLDTNNEYVIAFLRRCHTTKNEILICFNMNENLAIDVEIDLLEGANGFFDEVRNCDYIITNNILKITLKPFEFAIGNVKF